MWVYSKHKWENLFLKNLTSPFASCPASRSFSNLPAGARLHTKNHLWSPSCFLARLVPRRPPYYQLIVQSILVYYDSARLMQNLILLLFLFSLRFSLLLGAVFISLSFQFVFISFYFHLIFDFQFKYIFISFYFYVIFDFQFKFTFISFYLI